MLSQEEQKRYSKQTVLPEFGTDGQEKLRAARVLVVGAGGLGCPVLLYLTAAGVGLLGIADSDVVEISNLQRQVLYTQEDIGQRKAEVAALKLHALNPHIDIRVHPVYLDSTNALDVIKEYDIVVDGSDNFATRYIVNDACVIQDKPMVSGAIYKFEGQVSVFNYNNGPTYRCIFPEPPGEGESPNCADIGVIATLPGIVGTIQANEVIKIITGIGEVLSGKLLVIDTLDMSTRSYHFKLNPANRKITELKQTSQTCDPSAGSIDYAELQQILRTGTDIQLVDVRETEEHAIGNIGGINIPLSQFETGYQSLDPRKKTILYCASGVRSKHFAKQLIRHGFTKVINLENGIRDLITI